MPLDGALLFFDPSTGTHLRVQTEATRHLVRGAPRVVMFGITNACNLRCDFCSRDTARSSDWTVASAAATLRGLEQAGTLEVAFGGGEPLTFAGFADLIDELAETTALALHITTNGILVPSRWHRLAGKLGIVRLSVYEDPRWREAAAVLGSSGQRWGANVLVDDAALAMLPELLAELAALGAADVSILTYVGAIERQLGAPGAQRLAAILADAPLPARISVCAGTRVPVPRLFGGDCGAGLDFVSVTPDQRLQSCSFKPGGWPARNAGEILDAWRAHRAELLEPSPRVGCARRLPVAAVAPPRVAVWQAFAGNNSGECVAVATFETVPDAEAFLAELLPGWDADEPYGAEWRALFEREKVAKPSALEDIRYQGASRCPRELAAIGRSVIATGYDAGDQFPEVRALAWKRGGFVVPGGIHVHDRIDAVLAVRCSSVAEARTVLERPTHPLTRRWAHDDRVLAIVPYQGEGPEDLSALRAWAQELADGRPLAIELVWGGVADADLLAAKQRLGVRLPETTRLCAGFHSFDPDAEDDARAFARSLGSLPSTVAGTTVLFSDVESPKRLAILAYRRGASVHLTSGRAVVLAANVRPRPVPRRGPGAPLDIASIEALVRFAGGVDDLQVEQKYAPWVHVTVRTEDPARIFEALGRHADALDLEVLGGLSDTEPLGWTLRRVLAGVDGPGHPKQGRAT
ncbi:MAG: radical SAM protein, partial [Polyangiaceae bacterium]